MKILITGNLGYIGTVLVPILKSKGHETFGFDTGFFEECLIANSINPHFQIRGDIRNIESKDLSDCDAIIHLAGLSNDPLGELNAELTEEINLEGTIRIANLAKKMGVSRFIFASSQSIYGIANTDVEIDEYDSNKAPVTEYAKTKWLAEQELVKLANDSFSVVAFRPSTVFGASPRLRCDIVYNNFLGCAFTSNRIEIKSDGTPWRPVVHVQDVAKAFISGLIAPKEIINGKAFNVGIKFGNFTVRDIADAAGSLIPSSEVVYTGSAKSDERTYKVSFKKIFEELGQFYQPSFNLKNGGEELVSFFRESNFSTKDFTGSKTNRLKRISELLAAGQLNESLNWE